MTDKVYKVRNMLPIAKIAFQPYLEHNQRCNIHCNLRNKKSERMLNKKAPEYRGLKINKRIY